MKVLEKIANGISAVFYPLLIPSYGMILFCCATTLSIPLPWTYWLVMAGSAFIITFLIPLSFILYQVHKGDIQDIYIRDKDERTLAYMETTGCFAFWWYMLQFILNAPDWLSGIALGSTIAIALVAVINRWWKISAHLTGMGGLVGGILSYYIFYSIPQPQDAPYYLPPATCCLLYIALAIAWLVMLARLYLNAHTSWQVIAGFALGLGCTLIVPLLYV